MNSIRFFPFALRYLLILITSLAVCDYATSKELARFYDASHYKAEHESLGLLQSVKPMTMLYESQCWKNKNSLSHSRTKKTLPDDEETILKILRRAPHSPVLIDWESLPSGFFQRLTDEEVVARRNWYLTCMQHLRELADENGCGDRAWGIYGGVPYYGGYGKHPTRNQKGLRKSMQLWLKATPNLFGVVDFWCPDMALRYEVDGEWEAYETRCRQQANLAKLLPIPVYAMVKSRHHKVNTEKGFGLKELTMTGALRHIEIAAKHFDGVVFWIPNAENYGGPLSDRTRIGMMLALDRLTKQSVENP